MWVLSFSQGVRLGFAVSYPLSWPQREARWGDWPMTGTGFLQTGEQAKKCELNETPGFAIPIGMAKPGGLVRHSDG